MGHYQYQLHFLKIYTSKTDIEYCKWHYCAVKKESSSLKPIIIIIDDFLEHVSKIMEATPAFLMFTSQKWSRGEFKNYV